MFFCARPVVDVFLGEFGDIKITYLLFDQLHGDKSCVDESLFGIESIVTENNQAWLKLKPEHLHNTNASTSQSLPTGAAEMGCLNSRTEHEQ